MGYIQLEDSKVGETVVLLAADLMVQIILEDTDV